MRYLLTYCNRTGNNAMLEIITNNDTSTTEAVEGTERPFILSYSYEGADIGGRFLSSKAEIEIYESGTFYIENLKTLSETDILVVFTVDDVVRWRGYVVPDFFRRSIAPAPVIHMTASDRIGAMKNGYLTGLSERETIINLIDKCLDFTGLPHDGTENAFNNNVPIFYISGELTYHVGSTTVDRQLIEDKKMSAYDVLHNILVSTNSFLFQRNGDWRIYNKISAANRTPEVFIDDIGIGADREIIPVSARVGIFHKAGGQKKYPVNGDFSQGTAGWNGYSGIVYNSENRNILRYNSSGTAVYGEVGRNSMRIFNAYPGGVGDEGKLVQSDSIPVKTQNQEKVRIKISIGAIGRNFRSGGVSNNLICSVVAFGGPEGNQYLDVDTGMFTTDTSKSNFSISFFNPDIETNEAIEIVMDVDAVLTSSNLYNYSIRFIFYGTSAHGGQNIFITNAELKFLPNYNENVAGTLFRIDQGSNFSKDRDIESTYIGDKMPVGKNGYFYNLFNDIGSLMTLFFGGSYTPRKWITYWDYTERPLLELVATQISEMFSASHYKIRGTVDVDILDPRMTYDVCGEKYMLVSATHNFLTSEADIILEQVIFDNNIQKKHYIYSKLDNDSGY